ncbi:MAG TPA: hypothetical protein VNE62_09380 [Actinomycetota bacterium]|nr:hypothetical protein [Actinomycetota bacterium]
MRPPAARASDLLSRNRDLLLLPVLLASVFFLPGGVPSGVKGIGLVAAATLALQATGIVLVWRSNRIVNFAQVQVGLLAGVLFRLLVEQQTVVRGLRALCPPCARDTTRGLVLLNYWTSLAACLLLAGLLGWLSYVLVVRRFANAPRLAATVVTIGLAQLFASVQGALPGLLATAEQKELSAQPSGVAAPPPWRFGFTLTRVVFGSPQILAVVVSLVVLAAVYAFFRYSSTGIAMRAASENADRAATVGVDVHALTARVWLGAGLLSGVAGILLSMAEAAPERAAFGASGALRVLVVAVLARMTSLPIAAAAAVAVGVFDAGIDWAFGSTTLSDGLLLGIIAVALLLRRPSRSRAEEAVEQGWTAARESRPVPREMRTHVRGWVRALVTIGIVVGLGLPWLMSPSQNNLAAVVMIDAMIGMSLLVLTGWAGQISLGQFAFAAIGGYAAAVSGLPMPLALVIGGLAGAVVAVAVGIPALKLPGPYLAVATLAVAVSTTTILLDPQHLGGPLPDRLARPAMLVDQRAFYYLTLVLLVGVVAAVAGLRRSAPGRALIASRDNETAAQSFGVAVTRARLWAFGISGFIAAFAGALFAFHQNGVNAASYGPEQSVGVFLMTVIGGLGSLSGPLLGAAFLGLVRLASGSPLVQFLATGGGAVVLLLVVPGGLAQLVTDVRDSLLRTTARRNRIEVPGLFGVGRTALSSRAPVAPRTGAFVPARYAVPDQWSVPSETEDAAAGGDSR